MAGVELARVGTYEASTGPLTLTADDLASMVAAYRATVARCPVIKLGHTSEVNDGMPSVGWVQNLQLTDDGNCLVGDLAGVPKWLADAMPTAYPDRSIEAAIDYTDADGRVWAMVLDGVALLGAVAPAMGNLANVRELVTASRSTTASKIAAARARRIRRANYS
ncbi:MAG: hypothetical protein JWR37_1037 [Mycobacterium sp.]|nr:hypothetical protein [Mycobacterium sp.]